MEVDREEEGKDDSDYRAFLRFLSTSLNIYFRGGGREEDPAELHDLFTDKTGQLHDLRRRGRGRVSGVRGSSPLNLLCRVPLMFYLILLKCFTKFSTLSESWLKFARKSGHGKIF